MDSIIDSESLFLNIYKILKNNGFLIFSIFGTKTMENVKECFIKVEEKKSIIADPGTIPIIAVKRIITMAK